jgi:hypothetical protein
MNPEIKGIPTKKNTGNKIKMKISAKHPSESLLVVMKFAFKID